MQVRCRGSDRAISNRSDHRAADVAGGAMIDGGAAIIPMGSVTADGLQPMPTQESATPELLVSAGPVVPSGLVIPVGPVVPAPKGAISLGATIAADGNPATALLLPVRPAAPSPAPVLAAAPASTLINVDELPMLSPLRNPPLLCAPPP